MTDKIESTDFIINPIISSLQADINDYSSYDVIYILAYNNSEPINDAIYSLRINKEVFNEISKNLVLLKAPKILFHNYTHLNKINILSSNLIQKYNIYNYKLNDKNLVLPMLNISYYNIKLYLSQYNLNNELVDIYKLLILNKYFNVEIKGNILQNLQKYINNLNETNYWTNYHMCSGINLTSYFEERKVKNINKVFGDYLKDIHKKTNYIDPSKIMTKYNFKVNENNIFAKENILEILDNLPEKEQYLLICNLLITKSYCHLILNNIDILKIMKTKFKKYAQVFRYLIGYAWIRFYIEESMKKSYITKDDQFIFDINTASELPVYPFSIKYPKLNPYMPILVSDKALNSEFNVGCISDYKKKTKIITNAGICNLEEFKKNVNIFCTGDPNFNIFNNVQWDKDKIALGGSIMCACIQKYHPLNNNFNNYTSDSRLKRYFNEYYAKSDIDVMFLTDNYFDFYNKVKRFNNQIIENVCKYNSYAEQSHFKLCCDKQVFLFITEKDIEDILINNKNYDKDDIINDLENSNIKALFRNLLDAELIKYKEKVLSKINSADLKQYETDYPDYIDFSDLNFKLRLQNKKNDSDEKIESYNTNICVGYKYKIVSPHLHYPFELFMAKYDDFFATVHNFHLPCVRAYYNGNNVYMTPSCISAHLTCMNLDYKYFTGNSSPIEIINKYRMRGFGTWLNEDEKIVYLKYTSEKPFWQNLYNINLKAMCTIRSSLGTLDLNHKLFFPRLYNLEDFHESGQLVDINKGYFQNNLTNHKITFRSEYFNEIDESFNNSPNVTIINIIHHLETINSNGSISPVKKWVIEASWNIINQNIIPEPTPINNAIKYKIIY